MNSVRALEAEPFIKSAIQAECTIGREVVVKVHEDVNLESLIATENGQYAPSEGVDGFSNVSVNVPERVPDIERLTVTVNGTYTANSDGYNPVTVAVPERVPVTELLTVTANGQYIPTEGVDGFSNVTVAVPERVPVTESLSVTENGTYEPSEGIDGYNRVVVNVPPTVPDIEPLTVTEDGTYQSSGDGYNPVTVNTGVAGLRQEIASAETASGCSPLTDGITALTTYANEVTGAEDETLSDAVETLASKYGKAEFNPFAYVKSMQRLFWGKNLPENLVLDFEGNEMIYTNDTTVNCSLVFRDTTTIKHITFKNFTAECSFGQFIMFSSVITVTFDNCIIRPTNVGNFADSARQLEAIYGEFDMSKCVGAGVFFKNCPKLHTVRFKANTIGVSLTNEFCYNPAAFTTETWISIANALRADAPNGIRLNTKNIPIVSAIMGNNDNGTFVSDPNGSMSLMDFITTVKGWTVT